MRKIYLIIGAFVAFSSVTKAQIYPDNFGGSLPQDSLGLVNYIDSIVNYYDLPGLAATSILDQEIIWKGNFGYQNIENSVPVDDSTLFCCWSVSKPFTGAALMQLEENGLVDIDQNINAYLGFSVINPNFPLNVISPRQILSHVSSISDGDIYSVLTPGDSPVSLGYYLENYLVPGGVYYGGSNYLSSDPPGTNHNYCNIGIALAGYLVDTIYDGTFNEYCRDSIFELLDMGSAGWLLSEIDTIHLASFYNNAGGGNIFYPQMGVPWYPAGTMRATSTGLSNFVIAMLNGGIYNGMRILEEATVEEMSTPQYPAVGSEYGLCLANITSNGRNLTGHNGNGEWGKSKMWWCPDENTGIVILTNVNANTSALAQIQQALFDYALISGIDDRPLELELDFRVFPNPFADQVRLYFPTIEGEPACSVSMFDLLGRIVYSVEIHRTKSFLLDLTYLPGGSYFIRVESAGRSGVRRIIKL